MNLVVAYAENKEKNTHVDTVSSPGKFSEGKLPAGSSSKLQEQQPA